MHETVVLSRSADRAVSNKLSVHASQDVGDLQIGV